MLSLDLMVFLILVFSRAPTLISIVADLVYIFTMVYNGASCILN